MDTSADQVQKDEPQPFQSSTALVTNDERKPLPNKLKYLTAAGIMFSNLAIGCTINTYGPALTTMQHKYETDDATISKVFTIMTACNMIGALSAGFIFNHVNRQLAGIVILTTMAATMYITPHCPSLTIFFVTAGVLGLAAGSYDTAQFVWMMEMMQKDCPPYVQSQHFFYALGTNFAGWIMAPFLDNDDADDEETKTLSHLIIGDVDSRFANETSMSEIIARKGEPENGSKLATPYYIVGGVVSIGIIGHILLFTFFRYHPPPPEIDIIEGNVETHLAKEKGEETKILGKKMWPLAKIRMVLLCASFYAAYVGMEFITFEFFPKFGQNSDLHLSESKSTYVLTGMTSGYTVGRGIAIFAILKFPAQIILCINILLALLANILLVGWASNSITVLWIASILLGLGYSSAYASFSAFAERYLKFTNIIGSIMLVFGYAVAAIYPLIVGNFIKDNPIVLSYVIFLSIVILMFSLSTLFYLTHKDKTRH